MAEAPLSLSGGSFGLNSAARESLTENEGGHHRDGDAEVKVCEEDDGVDESPDAPIKFNFSWKKLWRYMGPGWLMSLAYLDPGNLESDLQLGAFTGYSLVWVLWWATVVGLILQEMAARIGVVSGRDLAQNVKRVYPYWLNVVIYINMELAVIASDIQEVVGSGIAINLLTDGWVPVWVGCIITGLDTFTFLAVHYLGVRYLEALICSLVACMVICFYVNWGETPTNAGNLFQGWIVPILHSYGVSQAIQAIGAVIMPHNLYLHSGLVISRDIKRTSPNRVNEAIYYNFIESALALLCSFFINLAIVAANANSFFNPICTDKGDAGSPAACLSLDAWYEGGNSADAFTSCQIPGSDKMGRCGDIGLQLEGTALKHGLGPFALYVWAVGLLAAGQAATMTCTYAGQVIMGGCLEIELAAWKRVALTRGFALGPSVLVAWLSMQSNVYNTINGLLNAFQSLQLPFAMLPLLHISAQANIMGLFKSGFIKQFANVLLAAIVMVVNAVLVVQYAQGFSTGGIVLVSLYGVVYIFLCARMVLNRPAEQRLVSIQDP